MRLDVSRNTADRITYKTQTKRTVCEADEDQARCIQHEAVGDAGAGVAHVEQMHSAALQAAQAAQNKDPKPGQCAARRDGGRLW